MRTIALAVPLVAAVLGSAVVSAQGGSGSIEPPRVGDCTIRVTLPSATPIASVRLLIDEADADAQPTGAKNTGAGVEFTMRLRDPLALNSTVQVRYTIASGGTGMTAPVGVTVDGHERTSCRPADDRGDFEPTLLIGVVSDSFAPNEQGNYPPNTDYSRKNSTLVKFDAQLRVGGSRGTWLDNLWVRVDATYGVRSGDLNCDSDVDKQSPLCDPTKNVFEPPKNPAATVTANVLRASRVEAMVRPRWEFYVMNPDGATPIALFLGARYGIVQFPDDPKPSHAFGAGGGLVLPKGAFRDSSFTVTVGQDRAYRTNPKGTRTRSDFRFLFNVVPGFADQLPFLPHPSQSVRGYVSVVIDSNFGGPGPDGFQTALGVVVDFRQLLAKQ